MKTEWSNLMNLYPESYTCGYCEKIVSSAKGLIGDSSYNGQYGKVESKSYIYICPNCSNPTFIEKNTQVPKAKYGNNVNDVSDKLVLELYDEARRAVSVNCYTASVLCCRKLLMHIAVDKGADEGKNFIYYVEYLSSQNYIPPDAKDWVDQIRKSGNEATHEIIIKEEEEAEDIISFVEMILRLVYEFPAKVKRKNQSAIP